MKDRDIAKIHVDQANKVLDVIEGKADPESVTVFRGSHLCDEKLAQRLEKYRKKKEKKEVKEIAKDKIIKKDKVKVK